MPGSICVMVGNVTKLRKKKKKKASLSLDAAFFFIKSLFGNHSVIAP